MDALNIPEIAVNSIIGYVIVQEGYQLVLNNDVTIYDEPQKRNVASIFAHNTAIDNS